MSTVKITALTATTDPASSDILPIVTDPSGSAATKKVTIENLMKNAAGGSASLPGVAFDGDPDSGVARIGANNVAICTNGTNRLDVGSAGVVDVKLGGSASTPALIFEGDVNTGISHSADTLIFSTAGTQRMLLNSTGNAEFDGSVQTSSYFQSTRSSGDTSVLAGYHNSDLNVNIRAEGSAYFNGQVIVGGSSALANSTCTINDDGYIFINRSSGNALIVQQNGGGSSSDNRIALGTDGSATFAGKVSIGTTISDEILHVAAASEAVTERDGVLLESTSSLAADTGLPLVFTSHIGTQANYGVASIAGRKENATSGEAGGYLQFATGNAAGAISEKMRISSSGTLTVGPQYDRLNVDPGSGSYDGDPTSVVIDGRTNDGSATAFKIDRYDNSGSVSTKFLVNYAGDVGIGKTSSLAAKLHIQDDSADETTLIKLRNYKSGVNTQAGLMFECSTSGSQGGNSLIKGVCGTDAGGSNSQNDGGLAFQTGSGGSGALATRLLLTSTGNAEFAGNVSVGNVSQVVIKDSGIFLKDTGNASASNSNLNLDTNGSATFGTYTSTTASSAKIWKNNSYGLYVNGLGDSDHRAFAVYKVDSTAGYKASIFHDGSATFEAGINVRTQDAARALTINSSSSSQTEALKINANGGAQVTLLKHDGSATFAGKVHIGTSTYAGNGQVAIAGNSSGSSAAGILDIRPTLSRPTAADTTLSLIRFGSADHTGNTGYASINMASDGDSTSDSDLPGRLEFHTTNDGDSGPTEKVRITNNGDTVFLKRVNNTEELLFGYGTSSGIYAGIGGKNNFNTDQQCALSFFINNSTTSRSPEERMRLDENGLISNYATGNSTNLKLRNSASSSSTKFFTECYEGATGTTSGGNVKFAVATNGGISNVQSNNVDLCDEREKKNIVNLETKWDKVKSWELKKFHYNEDADTDDLRYGVIAQQIETVCPEVLADWHKQRAEDAVLDEDGNVVTPAVPEIIRKGVKEQQMMWMAIKALQEAQARIETLEAKVAALE